MVSTQLTADARGLRLGPEWHKKRWHKKLTGVDNTRIIETSKRVYEMQDFEPPTPELLARLRAIIDEAFSPEPKKG